MTFLEVRHALIKASVGKPGEFIRAADVQAQVPRMSLEDVAAELGAMSDFGEATTIGAGPQKLARFDGLIWTLPDGSYGTVVDANRYVASRLDGILAEGYNLEVVAAAG